MKKYAQGFIILSLFLLVFSHCKKDIQTPSTSNKLEFGQTKADSISYYSLSISTQITNLNGNTITEHGHCWAKNEKPTIVNEHSNLGALSHESTFYSDLKNLDDQTQYHIRFYMKLNNGIIYGDDITVSTLKAGIPVVETNQVINITLNSAECQGIALADSGNVIIKKGFCWHTQEDFDIDNCLDLTVSGSGLGSFSGQLYNLSGGTTYYIKAYATNQLGTSYGMAKEFITENMGLPTIMTSDITNIGNTYAKTGGDITDNGNSPIIARGVCWNTDGEPSLENSIGFTSDGTGIGSFTSNITGLQEGTLYYVTAYATNEEGTAYGNIKSFTPSLIEWIMVEGGDFQMGSNNGSTDEQPIHLVSISSFKMSKYEISNAQYCVFLNDISCNSNGSFNGVEYINIAAADCQIEFQNEIFIPKAGKNNFPVVFVTWPGASEFAAWTGCRLATEAEWEFAARGGNLATETTYSGSNTIGDVAWYFTNSEEHTHEVGNKAPNELGLYDMSGNVWEWLIDWYQSDYYSISPQDNPQGPDSGIERMFRGGSWRSGPSYCRLAYRSNNIPSYSDDFIGFRVVKSQ